MKYLLHLLVLPFAMGFAFSAHAGEAQERMDRFMAKLTTLRAEFNQTVFDPDGSTTDESNGLLLVSRPDKFRLQYTKPYEQLYVADGKRVWLYDKDLAQVTVKAQSEALGNTPALLLSSTEPLSRNFVVSEAGEKEGLAWLELKPRTSESSFESVRLGLTGSSLKIMEMLDSFGQRTRIEFRNLERNVKLESMQFRFVPPPNVDVIGEDQ